ncbi:ubiquinone/menaquinone biosynthesis C-methylase UbiE [Lentzea atacamensis]|uniref:Ubiquinone/menaquinone biosynthesis C-methylase UbiE n=1 Tax=Lentzea atacamensis TaxID=531938 RepID=A0A316HNT0_9PSEU|nr:DUF6228 family protein [Lentzea atacamensis]PWK81978.1 ubiquinone/menaquinone biosynthesis C-methylase UbiE [Lentzea atacamensis]
MTRDLGDATRFLPGELVVGTDARIRFADRVEMIHPWDGRVFFSVEITAPRFGARLDRVTTFADGQALADFLACREDGEWVSPNRDLAVTAGRDELTWRIQTAGCRAEVTTIWPADLADQLREFLIDTGTVDTTSISEGGLWGRRAAQRAALGAKMSLPAWRTAVARTKISEGTTVLDLACGSGEFCALATEAGARATGIDASHEMIELARRTAPEAEFHVWPLGRLPWDDGTFDVVTAFNALFFAADPETAFAEAVRVSRDHVVVCDWHPEHPSDILTVGRAVLGSGGRRRAKMPEPQEELAIDIPQDHPDEDTMLRAFLSTGGYQRLIESEGEESVAEKIRIAAEPFRTADGGYRFANKYLMSIFRKNPRM